MKTLETLNKALDSLGIYPFRHESSCPEWNAERNLEGRTHFATPGTRKYFKSRILNAGITSDRLICWLVESNRSKPFEPQKNKRFVAFDVFGTELFERDDWHKTSAAAYKSGMSWLSGFDALTNTWNALQARAKHEAQYATAALEILSKEL